MLIEKEKKSKHPGLKKKSLSQSEFFAQETEIRLAKKKTNIGNDANSTSSGNNKKIKERPRGLSIYRSLKFKSKSHSSMVGNGANASADGGGDGGSDGGGSGGEGGEMVYDDGEINLYDALKLFVRGRVTDDDKNDKNDNSDNIEHDNCTDDSGCS
eukprot:Pgem_evm1s12084